MKKDYKKTLIMSIPYVLIWFLTDKASWLYRQMNPSVSSANRIMGVFMYYSKAFTMPLPSFFPVDLLIGALFALLFKGIVVYQHSKRKKFRNGVEYGSARWGTPEDIAPYLDPDPEKNIILTQSEGLMLNGRPKDPKYARNKNVMVIGGSGSGKTRFFVKPNIMQMHSSYVITDPKGTVLLECGKMLERGCPLMEPVPAHDRKTGKIIKNDKGEIQYLKDKSGNAVMREKHTKDGKVVYKPYRIKVFNVINFDKSMHYNPFAYIKKEEDIITLVTTLVNNTKGDGDKSGEDFWVKAEKLLYEAYIGYIWYEAPDNEKNFSTLLEFINASECREDDENFKNAVDMMFDELKEREPDHFAVSMYTKYKLAAGKTAKSILISCGARLAPFDIKKMRDITAYDEMELDTIGDEKTALFVIISDTNPTFNFIVSILYTQLFSLLCEKADDVYGGRLPVHVRCLLDEFANIGQIPNFEKLIATIRSREISACIILQAKSQLKAIYKDNADTIEGNCDTSLFLGGKEGTTLKELSEVLGKETIDMFNTSNTRGQSESFGQNYQKTGRDLMTRDELAVMDGSECILQIRGTRPFKSKKYDITKHKRYHLLSDYDKKNTFDVEKYMNWLHSKDELSPDLLDPDRADEISEIIISIPEKEGA
jgi:type IV secretion system protein VirD4